MKARSKLKSGNVVQRFFRGIVSSHVLEGRSSSKHTDHTTSPSPGALHNRTKRPPAAVGAVYDRAIPAFKWEKRAVIDRAYSRKWAANFLLCKAPRLARRGCRALNLHRHFQPVILGVIWRLKPDNPVRPRTRHTALKESNSGGSACHVIRYRKDSEVDPRSCSISQEKPTKAQCGCHTRFSDKHKKTGNHIHHAGSQAQKDDQAAASPPRKSTEACG